MDYKNDNPSYVRPSVWQSVFHPLPGAANEVRSICCLCNGGCGLIVKLNDEGRILGVYGDPANPFSKGTICPKPMAAAQSLYHPQRVTTPMIRINGRLTPASWEDALDITAARYLDYLAKYDNAAVVGIMSKVGGSYSKLALAIFESLTGLVTYGTSPVCTSSEEVARTSLLGNPSTPNPLWDVVNAKILLIVGNNVAQTKAGLFHWIMEARRQGTRIVVVDTRFTETAQQADLFLPIRPGTDGALALALIREVIANQTYDHDFVAQHTAGFADLSAAAQKFTPEYAENITGIPAGLIRNLAEDLGRLKPGMFFGGRGIMCTNNAAGAVLGFEALMCILGNLGKPGGGIVSHITGYGKPSQLVPPDKIVKPVKKRKAAELYPAMETGEIKMMLIAGNPAVTWPDSARMGRALAGLDFVVSHTLFMDDTAALATVVLPATHWLEEAGMQASVNRVLQWRERAVEPFGEAKSGGDFFRLLAKKMQLPAGLFPSSPEEAWEMERRLTPPVSGISLDLARGTAGGISYPYPSNGQPAIRLYADGQIKTPSGKVQLQIETEPLSDCYPFFHPPLKGAGNDEEIAGEYPLMLNTAKVAWHYHTQSQYSLWIKDIPGPYLELHPDLAREIGVKDGELVTVETRTGCVTLPARITRSISKDSVCSQYSFGQISPFKQQPVNTLFPAVYDPVGGNFVQKNLQCRIRKAKGGF
ncbi:MAG: molybdopterin-containing oxidoreductase family protein [Bacillota bacterium]